jgi:hypothetical protein
MLSKKKTTFQTPPDVIDRVGHVAPIHLDPFTSPRNPSRARVFCALEQGHNGLELDWSSVVEPFGLSFSNPPFAGFLPKAVAKFREQAAKGVQQVTLTPSRTDTAWFNSLAAGLTEGLFWRGRMTFYDLDTGEPALTWSEKKQRFEVMPAPFPVFMGYFGPNPERFREAFAGCGIFASEMCRD